MGDAKAWRVAALVAAVALAVGARSFSFDYTYLDDDELIVNERSFLERPASLVAAFGRSYFGGSSNSYYRPVVNASFVLDALGTGARPFRFHVTNTLLHASASVLLLFLGRRLGLGDLCATWAALAFAVHPVGCASVAWIPGRNDLLFGCFGLGACLALLHAPTRWMRAVHWASFSLALLSKETALVLPLIFAGVLWTEPARVEDGEARRLTIGWGAVLVAVVAVRSIVVGSLAGASRQFVELAPERWTVFVADWGKILLPVRPQALAAPEDVAVWPGAVAIVVLVLSLLVPGLRRRVAVFAGASGAVVLIAGIAGTRLVVLENRLYVAVAMTALLLAEVLRACRARWPRFERPFAMAALTLLLPLGVAAVVHAADFRDRFAFAQAAIQGSPHSGVAVNLLQRNARAESGVPNPR